jgi:hypothetical protein
MHRIAWSAVTDCVPPGVSKPSAIVPSAFRLIDVIRQPMRTAPAPCADTTASRIAYGSRVFPPTMWYRSSERPKIEKLPGVAL